MLEILDRAGIKIQVALWAFLAEYEDWRKVLSGRTFDELRLLDAYGLLHKSLRAEGFTVEMTPTILILPMSDPTIKDLRRAFRKTRSVEGMRIGNQLFGDRFIEDGFVYRIT